MGNSKFDIVQIEVTSRCNARCIMCPKTYLTSWISGDMDQDTFSHISELFSSAKYIHLQGWGEPLLHPQFEDMLVLIKKRKKKCGYTTNGQLLTKGRIDRFLHAGVDVIAISMAGADKKMHENIRKGTDFFKVTEAATYITEQKQKHGLKKPELVLLFIMTTENIHQLPDFIKLASELGANRVVPNNVDFVPCKEIDSIRAFGKEEKKEEYEDIVEKTKQQADKNKIELRFYPLFEEEQGICEANPLKNLYIAHDGCVSPCVYLGLPVEEIPIYRNGKVSTIKRVCFGNIKEKKIKEIWEAKDYVLFRSIFKKRRNMHMLDVIMGMFLGLREKGGILPAPPECKDCYKLLGF